MTPVVSVVMPVYNGAPHLTEALQSIADQTISDFECVVVDDGSTDDSPHILAAWSVQDPRFRVITKPHRGIVAALNTGIKAARAPLIARMDADDRSLPDRLARQVAFLNEHADIGLVASTVRFGGDVESERGFALFVDWNNRLISSEQIARHRFVEAPVIHPSVCFRRPVFDRFGPYRDDGLPEDYALWLAMLDGGVRFAKLPEPLLVWRDRPDRLSRRDPRCSPLAFARCKARFLARWLFREAPDKPVWVWGAGRTTRKRADCLRDEGVTFAGYVDIDPGKIGQRIGRLPVIAPDELPRAGEAVVLSYVGSRGARDLIRADLIKRSYREGRDFWLAG